MKVIKISQKSGKEAYVQKVSVSLYGLDAVYPDMLEDQAEWKADISFNIAWDARSWGIKNIYVTPVGVVHLNVSLTSDDGARSNDVMISFEPSKIQQNPLTSDSITVGDIDLWLNPDLTPNYEKSTIDIYGPTRGM